MIRKNLLSNRKITTVTVCLLLLMSCSREQTVDVVTCESSCYLHLSRTRTDTNEDVDPEVERLDFDMYDMLWLGGDLAVATSEDDRTMMLLNSIFDLGSTNTLWSLGNHDYADPMKVRDYTHRPTYYSKHSNGVTIVVLDTEKNVGKIVGHQKEFLFGILDTITQSSHLVLLHHKLVWMYDNPDLESLIPEVSNGPVGDCSYCLSPNNFNQDIYPKLVELTEQGLQVICVGGDIGNVVQEYQHVTPEGITLLASGIKSNDEGNKALLFHHDIEDQSLSWEFKLLTDLPLR